MSIKIRLTFQYSILMTIILIFFSLLVYYISYHSQLNKFHQNLLDSAKNSATLLINVAEVDSTLLKKIQESTISWEREELVITDSAFHMIYSNDAEYITDYVIIENYAEDDYKYFGILEKEGVCYRHTFENRIYYVYTSAIDKARIDNLSELRQILLWSILFSLCLSVLLSYIFAKRAIKPISKIVKSVEEINSTRLSSRLDEGNKKDEIAQLSIKFNEMLSDLERSFISQEDFVSNASHELRTPLTVMIGESDYFLSHDREISEYTRHIARMSSDLKKVNSLVNNLLELAQLNKSKGIILTPVRIDEIILNAIIQLKEKYQERKIVPKIKYPETDSRLFINGNEGLLAIAFGNLIDNACKFSNDDVIVEIEILMDDIRIKISDSGIGIPANDLESIHKPFSRASNVKFIAGFGVGLALVSKIFELHNAAFEIKSAVNEGTTIVILLKQSIVTT